MENYKQDLFVVEWREETIQANVAILKQMTEQHNSVVTQLDKRVVVYSNRAPEPRTHATSHF